MHLHTYDPTPLGIYVFQIFPGIFFPIVKVKKLLKPKHENAQTGKIVEINCLWFWCMKTLLSNIIFLLSNFKAFQNMVKKY